MIVQTKFQDRRHHPSVSNMPEVPLDQVLDLAASLPKARLVVAAAHFVELTREAERIKALPNLWLDLSHLDGLECLARSVQAVGARKLLFATCWPFFYAASAWLKVADKRGRPRGRRRGCWGAMRVKCSECRSDGDLLSFHSPQLPRRII